MLKLLSPLLFIFPFVGLSQSSNEIQNFQNQHPDKIVLAKDYYFSLSEELQEKLQSTVVFVDEIDQQKITVSEDLITKNNSTKVNPKQWVILHPEVKIVSRSVFDSSNEELQQIYIDFNSLILIGETLTQTDIDNYHF